MLQNQAMDCRFSKRVAVAHQLADCLARVRIRGTLRLGQLLSRIILGRVTSPVMLKTRHGFVMAVDPLNDQGDDTTIFLTGTTERGTLSVLRAFLRERDGFIDVGANIGLMTLLASSRVGPNGTVHGFEPVPTTFEKLAENVAVNDASNVLLHRIALGAKRAVQSMRVVAGHSGMSRLLDSGHQSIGDPEVEVETLDDLFSSPGGFPGRIAMVKLDVEGSEAEVLRGGRRFLSGPDAPALCVEYSLDRENARQQSGELWSTLTQTNSYWLYVLDSGDFRAGKLRRVLSERALPRFANLYCFLPSQLDRVVNLLM